MPNSVSCHMQVLHSSSHAMTVLTVEEVWSLVLVLPETAALEMVYPFKLLENVDSALVHMVILTLDCIMQAL